MEACAEDGVEFGADFGEFGWVLLEEVVAASQSGSGLWLE